MRVYHMIITLRSIINENCICNQIIQLHYLRICVACGRANTAFPTVGEAGTFVRIDEFGFADDRAAGLLHADKGERTVS